MPAARRGAAIRRIAASLFLLQALAACGSLPRGALAGDPTPADRVTVTAGPLESVPFHPQLVHHCGPAALATILAASGVDADPLLLAERVYVPARRGSFQVELVAATRSAGRIPWLVDGALEAVAAEVAAGRPVLVLQNLGLPAAPRWHYAVVVGIDADTVTLRSGSSARLRTSSRSFLRSWNWAGRWGLVALRPGEWPARPEPRRWLATMSDLELVGASQLATAGLEAATARWPGESLAWFALGNARYRAGRRADALAAWHRATRLDPGFAAGWNNLAQVQVDLGCATEARTSLARGLAVARDPAERRALEATAHGVADVQPASSTASACSSASGSP
ncbi:MAG: PA2778 family cysteine peptidase [Steroidobacteraceae bacterium]|jgi:tetratricopeptide (TPR) repeat protein|nr:PA2778 family cysteine peptidase [Steroidobacteraceae bacterium]